MAGSYPDVPGRRMAYDADGTIVGYRRVDGTTTLTEVNTSGKTIVNDEDPLTYGWTMEGVYSPINWVYLIFPELRDFDGLYANTPFANDLNTVYTSADTTNTWDGTWTQRSSNLDDSDIGLDAYRSLITTFNVSNIRAIRIQNVSTNHSQRMSRMHVYGKISAGETPDRMLYINTSTGLEYTNPIDWGNIPRGTIYDEDFYIKNNSSTLTANNTNLDFEALYLSSVTFYTLSTGVGWSTSYGPISTIGASSRWPPSNSLTVRCDPPSTAELGLHAARIVMNTSSWS